MNFQDNCNILGIKATIERFQQLLLLFISTSNHSVMKLLSKIVINCCCIISLTKLIRCQNTDLSFPKNFKIGAASAAYQVEGAWNLSGKGESVWDQWTHDHPEYILDHSNGDVACDFYHKYPIDIQLMKEMGVDYYRFSISWTRILPTGFANRVSEDGVRFYKNLIQSLLDNDIEPVVTIYHFDHPAILEEMGGWTNELMVEWYADYARIVFEEFGPMVKTFLTINEPTILCQFGYNGNSAAPGKILNNIGNYLCVHNILKAHATAWHIYDDEYRPTQRGKIGLVTSCSGWVRGENITDQSIEEYFQFDCGWVMHPIYIGDYPDIMKTRIAMISELEGYSSSRLPTFSQPWIDYIRYTSDFFGLNHYTSFLPVLDPAEKNGIYSSDSGLILDIDPSWPKTASPVFHVVPEGFRNLLRMIKDRYDNPPLYVTENGYNDVGELNDYNRIDFHYKYVAEMLKAIREYGCNVLRYTIWSLTDSFEFSSGYTIRFGVHSIDFESDNRTRTPRLSASWWKEVIRDRKLQDIPTRNSTR